ncbi:hypothetical protein D3C87_766360 [compost metagenome]
MKRLLTVLATSALALSLSTSSVFAADNSSSKLKENTIQENIQLKSNNEVSQLFSNYIKDAFNNLKSLNVRDSSGTDITQSFITDTSESFHNGDFKKIKDIIQEQNLSISYAVSNPAKKSNGFETESVSGESVSKRFYHSATDKTLNSYTKEWVSEVSGTFSYSGTWQVTSTSTPVLSLPVSSWGTSFSPYFSSVSTYSSHSGYNATFTASYNMRSTVTLPVLGSFGISKDLDFGNYTDSFTASASGAQN